MTDEELIARLREDVFYGDERLHNLSRHNPLHMEAADRIEALVGEKDRFAERHQRHLIVGAETRARAERLEAALLNIAEGNLGDAPWQANYSKIKDVARAALKGDDHE